MRYVLALTDVPPAPTAPSPASCFQERREEATAQAGLRSLGCCGHHLAPLPLPLVCCHPDGRSPPTAVAGVALMTAFPDRLLDCGPGTCMCVGPWPGFGHGVAPAPLQSYTQTRRPFALPLKVTVAVGEGGTRF